MRRRRFGRGLLGVVVVGSLVVWPAPARADAFSVRSRSEPLPGVEVRGLRTGTLSVDVGRVAKGAPVRVEVVTAGAVGGGVETTSAVCRRVGGILCVNGDFASCRTCTTAFGGIVHDNVLLRSPVGGHEQLSLGPAGPSGGAVGWTGTLEATVTYIVTPPPLLGLLPVPPVERVDTVRLGLDGLNRARGANQVVLFTPPWGASTATSGGDEAVLGGGPATLGSAVGVGLRSLKEGAGGGAIPGDGMVVSAEGAGSARLRAFWAKASDPAAIRRSVVLRTSVDRPAEESVGGHPVVLARGRTVEGDRTDPFETGRNPRTLVGWNPAGDLVLATIDGRQPGFSVGASLVEAADVLRQLGATEAFNLDGGGSSTFVSLAGGSRTPLVLNRPSDGTERRVTTVLAVVPLDAGAVRTNVPRDIVAPPPPQPRPAPPGPPPADPASTDGLPARARPAVATTSTAPATTLPPANTTAPPPPEPSVPEVTASVEVAAPAPPVVPAAPVASSTGIPATVAALALLAASAATVVVARSRRRHSPGPRHPRGLSDG